MTAPREEREVFGITYDRLRLDKTFEHLVKKYAIKTALELPAGGAKAMPSIYSLALARMGVDVTLFSPEPQGLAVWDRLGLPYKVIEGDNPRETGLSSGSYDLVWNFVNNNNLFTVVFFFYLCSTSHNNTASPCCICFFNAIDSKNKSSRWKVWPFNVFFKKLFACNFTVFQ